MHANKHVIVSLLLMGACVHAQPQIKQHGLRVGTAQASLMGDNTTCLDSRRGTLIRLIQADGSIAAVDPSTLLLFNSSYIEFESWVEQLGEDYAESITGGCTGGRQSADHVTFERFVRDNFRKVYSRYTVAVEALPEAGSYRVTLSGSTAPPPADIRNHAEEWKIVTMEQYPVPQIMREGDELAVELTTYPGGVKLRDYIHVGSPDKMARRTDAARDFYAEDAEFTLARPSLRVNGGEPLKSEILPEFLRGGVLWLYVPGVGRYIASYLPHAEAGFERAGEITGGLMTLTVGGNVVRISSAERIAPGGGVYNVYGMLDRSWTPADPQDQGKFMAGTSPAVETALGRLIVPRYR